MQCACRVTWSSRRRRRRSFVRLLSEHHEPPVRRTCSLQPTRTPIASVLQMQWRCDSQAATSAPCSLEEGETEEGRRQSECANYVQGGNLGRAELPLGLWHLAVRSAGPTHKDNRSQKLITWTTTRSGACLVLGALCQF